MNKKQYKSRLNTLRLLLLLNVLIIPCLIFIIAKRIWDPQPTVLVGLFAALGWMYFLARIITKKIFELGTYNEDK